MGEAAEAAGNSLLPVLNDLFGFLNSSVAPVVEQARPRPLPIWWMPSASARKRAAGSLAG
jgi:hypothetical protein